VSSTDAGSDVTTGGGNDATGGGNDVSSEVSTTGDAEGGVNLVARGDYLVNHVAICGECHTPRKMDGSLDTTKLLSGSPIPFADFVPDTPDGGAGIGKIYVRNLTPDMATGLGAWTNAQIKDAFLNGKARTADGGTKPLFFIMPYFVYHNMTDQDADAIVAYLRSIPAIPNAIPDREPLPFPFTDPAPPFPAAKIPDTTLSKEAGVDYERAQRGRYLAGNVGVCMECHTEHNMVPPILKESALFGGNESFPSALIGLPPVYPPVIYSANITPDATGLMGWAPADVVKVLKTGVNKLGQALCPPMPFGPNGAFGGLTDSDALDIATYITTLPPVANAGIQWCNDPFRTPPPDGGGSDGPTGDGAAE
jgi:mono/diheme cytochrome c family protein